MPGAIRHKLALGTAAAAVALLVHGHGWAAASSEQSGQQQWEEYLKKGDLRSAEIELHNAIKAAPHDPALHARLAMIYMREGDAAGAVVEARTARDLHGDEADYLVPLSWGLLTQRKFDEVLSAIKPGNRPPQLESQVRDYLGAAELGLRDFTKAEALMREAVKLDPKNLGASLGLARFLAGKDPKEAGALLDEVLKAVPKAVQAIELKGELAWNRGDHDGALRLFDEALKIAPNYWQARIARARANVLLDHFAAADQDLDPVLKVAPHYFEANYLRALELTRQHKYKDADQILTVIAPQFGDFANGYYLQGGVKFMLGQYGLAEAALAKYVARIPDNPRAVQLIALAALRQGGVPRAIAYLKPAADKLKDPMLLSLLGEAYMSSGQPALALQQFQQAAKLDPKSAALKTKVAESKMQAGQFGNGLAELEQVFDTKGGETVAGPVLALTELRAGHPDKAAKVAAALVKSDEKNPVYETLLGVASASLRDYPTAEKAFRAAQAAAPDFAPAAYNLAQLYVAMGRTDDARQTYQALLAKQPNAELALVGLADLDTAEQKWQPAIDALNRARSAAPKDPQPGLKLVRVYLLQHNWTAAKATAAELSTQFPGNLDLLEAEAQAQLGAGDQAGAIATYKHAHDVAPDSDRIFARYLSLLLAAKDYPTARAALQAAIERFPAKIGLKADMVRLIARSDGLDAGLAKARDYAKDDPKADAYDLVSADLLERAGRQADAVALLEKAAAAQPADDNLTVALVAAYARGGAEAKAEALLKQRLQAAPKDERLAAILGERYMASGQRDAAIAQYNAVLAASPHDPVALNNLATLYQQKGDLAKARAFAEQALAAAPRAADVQDTLGWILVSQGDAQKAVTYLGAANAAAPRDPTIQYHLAVALKGAGKTADARKLLETLIGSGSSFADKPAAEKLLAELKQG